MRVSLRTMMGWANFVMQSEWMERWSGKNFMSGFQPLAFVVGWYPGRWPGLVYGRAFGAKRIRPRLWR